MYVCGGGPVYMCIYVSAPMYICLCKTILYMYACIVVLCTCVSGVYLVLCISVSMGGPLCALLQNNP